MASKLIIKGTRCRVLWGKPQQLHPGATGSAPRPGMLPPQVAMGMGGAAPIPAPVVGPNFFNLPTDGALGVAHAWLRTHECCWLVQEAWRTVGALPHICMWAHATILRAITPNYVPSRLIR